VSIRPENVAHLALLQAREARGDEWPEPETTALFRALKSGASRVVYSIFGHREPELANEIASRCLLRLGAFKGRSQFSTWFYRVARNEAIRAVTEDRPREEQFEDHFEIEAPNRLPVPLPRLVPGDETLLRLVLSGESFECIGEVLGVSKMTVSRRWARLREKLGALYG
jgi:RNA polymerase sigma factor (sigma-70 family)